MIVFCIYFGSIYCSIRGKHDKRHVLVIVVKLTEKHAVVVVVVAVVIVVVLVIVVVELVICGSSGALYC